MSLSSRSASLMACGVSLKRQAGRSGGLGYSFRAILRQSSQKFSVNC
jgi:hypothetical protein